MKQWQIGYRLLPCNPYGSPYTDLPEFDAPQSVAFSMQSVLQRDFPSAEWRLVECRNTNIVLEMDRLFYSYRESQ